MIIMQGDMCCGRLKEEPPRPSLGRGHGEGSFHRKEDGGKGVGPGTSFLAGGTECDKAWRHEAACGLGWGDG